MSNLVPKQSIHAAIAAYSIKNINSNLADKFQIYPSLAESFDFSTNARLNSKTGAFVFKSKSGFGVIAKGKGLRQGEVLIALRGTASAYDWVTDANIGLQNSTSGRLVHAGFSRVFKEFENDLMRFFSSNNPSYVHCVGHSLGGAIASLTADWIAHNKVARPKLYTFGSPRTGLSAFSERLTLRIGNDSIFRVYHQNDIVSMIPAWPFLHVPQPGISCCLSSNGYNPISAHYKENYDSSIADIKDWISLRLPEKPESSGVEIKNWLSLNTVSVLSSFTLGMIGKAISYILEAAGIGIQLIGIAGITLLDKLSYALDKAVQVSTEISGFVFMLLERILTLVGSGIRSVKSVTIDFIRWVFRQLSDAVYRMVNLAIKATS